MKQEIIRAKLVRKYRENIENRQVQNLKQGRIMQKNKEYILEITDMGVDGEGIGKAEGVTLFVKDTVIGDLVRVKVMKMKKTYGYARMMEIVKSSPYRVEPKCSLSRQCGGCQIQSLSYEKQLEFKEKKVRNNLERIAGLSNPFLEPIVGMEEPYHFRNKEQFPIRKGKDGQAVAGFFAARTHHLIPVTNCLIGVPVNEIIIREVLRIMNQYGIEPYEEETHSGLVRHVLIRYGFTSKEIMVCFVLNGEKLPYANKMVEALCKIEGMASITININTEKTNVILGSTVQVLWGRDFIMDELDGIRFRISPLSFYQVNPRQTEKLYRIAMDYAGLTGTETVWDMYCGIGTISLFLSRQAGQVYGVEVIPQAIEDARRNAELNGISNVEFFVGKAEEVVPRYYEEKQSESTKSSRRENCPEKTAGTDAMAKGLHPDVVVVDPPRKGCAQELLATICRMAPERIVYVSCDSATLARDVKYLCENGYEFVKGRPVDQFGHSSHVECVVEIQRKHI